MSGVDVRGFARYTRDERIEQIRRRIASGMTNREVAADLGLSLGGVRAILSDPDGSKDRARKERYGGRCEVCGARTTGANGRAKAPKLCAAHALPKKVWTGEAIIDAIHRFAIIHGRPPTADEWRNANVESGYPSRSSVYRTRSSPYAAFASWADAIETAGFPRPRNGHYQFESRERRVAASKKAAA